MLKKCLRKFTNYFINYNLLKYTLIIIKFNLIFIYKLQLEQIWHLYLIRKQIIKREKLIRIKKKQSYWKFVVLGVQHSTV